MIKMENIIILSSNISSLFCWKSILISLFYLKSFGFLQNFVDLIDTKCCFYKPTLVNWKKEHDIQDLLASRKKTDKSYYQEV